MSGRGQAEIAAARPSFVSYDNNRATRQPPNLAARAFQYITAARYDGYVDALPGKRQCAGLSEAPTCAADQRIFTPYAEVHVCSVKKTREYNSSGDGRDRFEFIAVCFVELETGDDAKTFLKRVRV
jgi:hypothetical protein